MHEGDDPISFLLDPMRDIDRCRTHDMTIYISFKCPHLLPPLPPTLPNRKSSIALVPLTPPALAHSPLDDVRSVFPQPAERRRGYHVREGQ